MIQGKFEEYLLRWEIQHSAFLRPQGVQDGRRGTQSRYEIDEQPVRSLSGIVRTEKLDLASTVHLVRGESEFNPRQNKALRPELLQTLLDGYLLRVDVVAGQSVCTEQKNQIRSGQRVMVKEQKGQIRH
ncbi:hypothetical protein FI667_g819, partial [Globisporangium splendens]